VRAKSPAATDGFRDPRELDGCIGIGEPFVERFPVSSTARRSVHECLSEFRNRLVDVCCLFERVGPVECLYPSGLLDARSVHVVGGIGEASVVSRDGQKADELIGAVEPACLQRVVGE